MLAAKASACLSLTSTGIFVCSWSTGGLWAAGNSDSPAYNSLVTNSSNATTYLDPLPAPAVTSSHIPRAQAEQYLQQFAQHHSLHYNIRFSTSVEEVKQSAEGDKSWTVTQRLVTTGQTTTSVYRAVIVATGTQSRSNAYISDNLNQQADNANIPAIHSSDYREPSAYAGKSVLIVGLGNSASEIATEVSRVAARTLVAVRTTPWILPLDILGVPSDVVAGSLVGPPWFKLMALNCLQRLWVGHPTSLGFPTPPSHGLLGRKPIMDRGIAQALRTGRVQVRPNIASIRSEGVTFEGAKAGEVAEKVDAIIFATGYRRLYPYLPTDCRTGDELPELTLTLFHPTHTGLLFMPEITVPQGVWPTFTLQADAIVSYLLADAGRSERCVEFNMRRCGGLRYASPDCKGGMFRAANKYHANPALYHRMLSEFSQWMAGKDK